MSQSLLNQRIPSDLGCLSRTGDSGGRLNRFLISEYLPTGKIDVLANLAMLSLNRFLISEYLPTRPFGYASAKRVDSLNRFLISEYLPTVEAREIVDQISSLNRFLISEYLPTFGSPALKLPVLVSIAS